MPQHHPAFLERFGPDDRQWLLDHAITRQLLSAQVVGEPGTGRPPLLVVIEGLIGMYRIDPGGHRQQITSHGPGDIVGEARWLAAEVDDDQVVAEEPCIVMCWPPSVLERRLATHPGFAAAFYKALAAIGVRRGWLRDRSLPTSHHGDDTRSVASDRPTLSQLDDQLRFFKDLIRRADRDQPGLRTGTGSVRPLR